MIIRYPGVATPGSTPSEMVQTIDLASTIVALTGAPDSVVRQGRSLLPVLAGNAPGWRTSVLIEYYNDTVFPRALTMGYQAVRTERYKYINYTSLPGMDELYDLETDPFEMQNLMGTDREAELLPMLRAELERLQRETGYRPGE